MMAELRSPEQARTLPEQVAEILREYILSGEIHSGEQVVQADIARRMNISRGPVREALRQLAAEGLVEEVPRRGTFVTAPDANDVQEVFDLRVGIEVRAAQLVMKRGEQALVPLRTVIKRMRAAANQGRRKAVVQLDYHFHESLCRLSGNGRLLDVFLHQAATLRTLLGLDEMTYETLDELVAEHERLLDALDNGSADLFQRMLTEHIEEARDRLVSHLKGEHAMSNLP